MPDDTKISLKNISVAILMLIIIVLADLTGYLGFIKNFRSIVLYPITQFSYIMNKSIVSSMSSLIYSSKYKNENSVLRNRVLELESIVQSYETTQKLSPSLQELLNQATNSKYSNQIVAQVLTNKYNHASGVLLLNKGAKDNIRLDMPVVIGANYVGYISDVYEFQSVCTTFAVPGQEFVAYIVQNKVSGILHTQVNDMVISDLLASDKVNVQDTVQIRTKNFPYLFTIGNIKQVPNTQGSAEKSAIVWNKFKLEDLNFVTIVTE